MTLLSWFRRNPEPDYETVLSQLEARIKTREDHLLSIRLRERRANALFITYGIGAWFIYSFVWYFILRRREEGGLDKLVVALPVGGLPVVIIFTRRIMSWWFKRKQDRETSALRVLKKEQQDKVEELKRKTGYYSTRNLLEKYDEGTKKSLRGTPIRTNSKDQSKNTTPVKPGTPQLSTPTRAIAPNMMTPQNRSNPNAPPMPPTMPGPVGSGAHLPLLPPALSSPAPRTVLDKLADALLGVSDETAPHNKYALICANCFSHNGLVVKEEWDTIQYRCPRCGYFNPRKVSKDEQSEAGGMSGGEKGHRRRVQSVHVTHMRRHDSDFERNRSGSLSEQKEEPKLVGEGDQVMGIGGELTTDDGGKDAEEVLMTEKSEGEKTKARRRVGAPKKTKKIEREEQDEDAMDTDP